VGPKPNLGSALPNQFAVLIVVILDKAICSGRMVIGSDRLLGTKYYRIHYI